MKNFRRAVPLLSLLGIGLFAAPLAAAPRSISDCEKIQAADAYNQCLASFGPVAHLHGAKAMPDGDDGGEGGGGAGEGGEGGDGGHSSHHHHVHYWHHGAHRHGRQHMEIEVGGSHTHHGRGHTRHTHHHD
ncbi:hypothetical protein CWB41_02100 [Methylovirgula ligni]|uniref:Uncharacterized protein n=1 Tax=Methylovirgula ligni TaxID=569860 RepID=A0A3D9YXE9_9HYPH|nr:hypothetical protein [Methylovirgula ligni]QAY94683.1 hypothetical protein CWB41_02100 [Methylovirgula ligni]REF87434.1 hypothetical protein DES32_1056 [Methylovirgula ligni]